MNMRPFAVLKAIPRFEHSLHLAEFSPSVTVDYRRVLRAGHQLIDWTLQESGRYSPSVSPGHTYRWRRKKMSSCRLGDDFLVNLRSYAYGFCDEVSFRRLICGKLSLVQ
jgi:hypothetical protein